MNGPNETRLPKIRDGQHVSSAAIHRRLSNGCHTRPTTRRHPKTASRRLAAAGQSGDESPHSKVSLVFALERTRSALVPRAIPEPPARQAGEGRQQPSGPIQLNPRGGLLRLVPRGGIMRHAVFRRDRTRSEDGQIEEVPGRSGRGHRAANPDHPRAQSDSRRGLGATLRHHDQGTEPGRQTERRPFPGRFPFSTERPREAAGGHQL